MSVHRRFDGSRIALCWCDAAVARTAQGPRLASHPRLDAMACHLLCRGYDQSKAEDRGMAVEMTFVDECLKAYGSSAEPHGHAVGFWSWLEQQNPEAMARARQDADLLFRRVG